MSIAHIKPAIAVLLSKTKILFSRILISEKSSQNNLKSVLHCLHHSVIYLLNEVSTMSETALLSNTIRNRSTISPPYQDLFETENYLQEKEMLGIIGGFVFLLTFIVFICCVKQRKLFQVVLFNLKDLKTF